MRARTLKTFACIIWHVNESDCVQCFDPAREIRRLLSFTSLSRRTGSSSHETMCSNVGDLEIPISGRARTFGDAWISFFLLLLFARSLARSL